MAQVRQAQAMQLRTLSPQEVVALALNKRRKNVAKGKTSKRITLFLRPFLVPPNDGTYETGIGVVRIKSTFKVEAGHWITVVVFPETEGFPIRDLIGKPSDLPPSTEQQS